MQYKASRPLPRLLKRSVLLGGAATLSLALANTAHAQGAVYAREGQTLDNVTLTNGGRLIVDISRVDPQTGNLTLGANGSNPPVISGTLDASAADNSLWLIATQSQTRALVDPTVTVGGTNAGFENGIVYEAFGDDTILTLGFPLKPNGEELTRNSLVRVAGNGTVNIAAMINVVNSGAIFVEEETTAGSVLGQPADRLDLVISDAVIGNDVSADAGDPRAAALINIVNADSLTFAVENGRGIDLRDGIAILASDQDIVINAGTEMRAVDSSIDSARGTQQVTFVHMTDEGTIENHGALYEMGSVGGTGAELNRRSTGVVLSGGGTLRNARTDARNFGLIQMHGAAVAMTALGGTVINDGVLESLSEAAINTDGLSDRALVRNNAQGIIRGAGVAYQGGGGQDMLVNAGTVDGDVNLGAGEDAFLHAIDPATGNPLGTVNGVIDGGAGNQDAFGRSFTVDAGYALADSILADMPGTRIGFERHGVEALGVETDVLLTSNATLANGLTLFGDGTITNEADITLASGPNGSINHAIEVQGNHRLGFVNRGRVEALNGFAFQSLEGALRSFDNAAGGEMVARTAFGGGLAVEIFGNATEAPFRFNNAGTITHLQSGGGVSIYLLNEAPESAGIRDALAFTNTGTITGGNVGLAVTAEGRSALGLTNSGAITGETGASIRDFGGPIAFENSGQIIGRIQGLDLEGVSLGINNSNIIEANGDGGAAIFAYVQADGSFNLVNRAGGRISATAAGIYHDPAGGGNGNVSASTAVLLDISAGTNGNATATSILNEAGSRIEAAQPNSIAVVAWGTGGANGSVGSAFELTNRGLIAGSGVAASTGILLDGQLAFQGATTAAGAIQTYDSADRIVNEASGTITGDVDLNRFADRFEARGTSTLTGNLRLGEGDDTVLLAGGTITGSVAGGDDDDTIAVDLSVAEQTISAAQFSGFENIVREGDGNGIVNIVGAFDTASLDIRGVTLRIRQGTTVRTTGDRTFDGSSEAERLIVEGAINDSVRLGEGNDRVEMGSAGSIGGDLELGAGNDTLVLGSGSTVGGAIDGGEDANGLDNDIIGFELTQDMASVPAIVGNAVNFETIQVSGDHKLTLGLTQSYQAISLINGADLDLTIADGVTLGGIEGDATSQNVTITGDLTGGVSLGGGSDTLTMNGFEGTLSSVLDGGEDANGLDNDVLNLNIVGTTTFGNGASGFETINVDGTAQLIIDGDFAAGQSLNFGAGDNHLVIGSGAAFGGTVNGGAGNDLMSIATNAPDSRTVVSAQINGFETLDVEGDGTLALTGGAYGFANGVNVTEGGNLELGADTHLTANVTFTDAHDDRLTLSSGARITGTVNAGERAGDRDVLAFQQAGGQVSRLGDFGLSGLTGFEQMAVLGAGEFHIDRNLAAFDSVVLEGGNLVVDAGNTLTAEVLGRDVADPGAAASDDSVTVAGAISGDVRLGGGDDTVDNRGRIDGDVDLGAGDDRYIARDGGVVTGTIDGGSGDNTFIFRLGGQNGSIPGNVANFNSIGVYGAGTLEIALAPAQRYENFELLEGANLTITEDRGGSIGTIIGDDSAQTVTIGSTLTDGVELGGGNDTLNLTLNGVLSGALNGGENADGSADNDVLNLTLAGASTINGMNDFEAVNVTGIAALTMAGEIGDGQSINFLGNDANHLILAASSTLRGSVDGGAGADLLEIETGGADQRTVVSAQIRNFENLVANGSGTLVLEGGNYSFDSVAANGNLTLGAGVLFTAATGIIFGSGDNRFTLASGAAVSGAVSAGDGTDTLALIQAAGFTRALSALDATGFERLESAGGGTLRIDRNARFDAVTLDGGTTIVTAGTTLTGNVTGGANSEFFEVFGNVVGNVDLGAGDDWLALSSLTGITGSVQGGEGRDTVLFDSDATYAAPIQVAGDLFDGFERLGVRRGVVSLTGASEWSEVNVSGGRLIGQAGSTLTADRVTVAQGATFGSAGIVNADIDVAGTLSPGASPGTMTVNGDVAMLAGSNLLIELTPTAGTDLLDVNGTLTIASGAAMDITGALGNLPGSVLDIVVADTIAGRFTTINKSASVFGFVVQNGNRIQIRSEFNNDDAYPTNVQASVGYSNQVLRDSYGVQAYTAALNLLTAADGTINQRAFAQLTPEAYGSAMQIGVENGLQLADAGRALRLTAPQANGLYGFAQGLIGDSDIAGQAGTGASRADLRTRGFMGGVGYGMGEGRLRVGAFVGRSDTDQTLTALGARTNAEGFFGGVFADAAIGGLGVHAMVSYSDLGAETRRNLLVSPTPSSGDYRLKSWVADLGVDYTVSLGGLDVTPKLGLTHIGTRRGDVVEQGGGDFALAVAGARNSAWFADAGVAISGTADLGGVGLRPYAELGVRRMLNDSAILVAGGYDGAPGAPIVVNGVERDRTVGRYGFGLGIDASDNVRFRLGYTGEFDNTKRSSLTAGATLRF